MSVRVSGHCPFGCSNSYYFKHIIVCWCIFPCLSIDEHFRLFYEFHFPACKSEKWMSVRMSVHCSLACSKSTYVDFWNFPFSFWVSGNLYKQIIVFLSISFAKNDGKIYGPFKFEQYILRCLFLLSVSSFSVFDFSLSFSVLYLSIFYCLALSFSSSDSRCLF